MINSRPVQVRVYDLGGYGDVAAAVKVASHLAYNGHDVSLLPSQPTVFDKLNVLKPDVPVAPFNENEIIIDGYGSYKNANPPKSPHIVFGDFDIDEANTSPSVHIFSWLSFPNHTQPNGNVPFFYRPYREWELETPSSRDARDYVLQTMFTEKDTVRGDATRAKLSLEERLNRTERIAFGHFYPRISAESFFRQPYVMLLEYAAEHFDTGFALGLFFDGKTKDDTTRVALEKGYSVADNTGVLNAKSKGKPLLIFLGPQPLLSLTQLMMSSTMPNIVTGDNTLSDAIYTIISMEGQGFFYNCLGYRFDTLRSLRGIIHKESPFTAGVFQAGSTLPREDSLVTHVEHQDFAVNVLGNPQYSEFYRTQLRNALVKEITARFGESTLKEDRGANGFRIPNGAPFLVQDAVEREIRRLQQDPVLFEEIERIRKFNTALSI